MEDDRQSEFEELQDQLREERLIELNELIKED